MGDTNKWKQRNIRLTREQDKLLRDQASDKNMSVSGLLRYLVSNWLEIETN